MQPSIEIIDQGRGPQLSTCRITVQDLVPYFQDAVPAEEIMRWIPVLSREEIAVVDQYIRDHHDQVMEVDRQIRKRNEQRRNSPQVERILEQGRAERLALQAKFRCNGAAGLKNEGIVG